MWKMEKIKFSLARYIAGLHRVNLNLIICMSHEYACELNTLEGGKINLYRERSGWSYSFYNDGDMRKGYAPFAPMKRSFVFQHMYY